MSLLPPAFKDPAFVPLGPPIKRRATFAQMREACSEAHRYNALKGFETRNHGNADTGCLQEGGGGETAVTLVTKESVGRMITDLGRRALTEGASSYSNRGSINFDQAREMLDADVAHMRESKLKPGPKLADGRGALVRSDDYPKSWDSLFPTFKHEPAKPSPELASALTNAQAALAEHLFGEVRDPFEKAAAKLKAKDAERALQMKAKADAMLQAACGVPTWNDALVRKLLEADASRKPTQPKPKSLRDACRDKMFDLTKKDKPLVTNILRLFGAKGLAGVEDKYLPDLWDQLNRPF